MIEVLSPGVQDGGEADLGAEMLGIGGDRRERLGRGLEQKSVDLGLVLIGDGADRRRQREHDVEIGDRQEFGLARLQPPLRRRPLALRTMAIAARVVGDARMSAVLASLDVTAERRGATDLDRRHDAPLGEAQMALRWPCASGRRGGGRHPPPPAWPRHGRRYQAGDAISMFRSSSGLWICRMVLIATRA